MAQTISILGSASDLVVDLNSGEILSGDTEYDIQKFNIKELQDWCLSEMGESDIDGEIFDILAVGYWTKDGKYTSPEEDFREELQNNNRHRP